MSDVAYRNFTRSLGKAWDSEWVGAIQDFWGRLKQEVRTQGDLIVKQGEVGYRFYLIGKGRLEGVGKDGSGSHLLEPGDYFGAQALLKNIVQPETVVRWHQQGFRLYWRWKSRSGKVGRPTIDAEIRKLIRRMSRENPLWGTPRIRSELRLLGHEASKATVDKYKVCHHKPPSQTWRTFDQTLSGLHRAGCSRTALPYRRFGERAALAALLGGVPPTQMKTTKTECGPIFFLDTARFPGRRGRSRELSNTT
ncbi:MAG: cyclic nucleotide-binding domain-containing protein [Planctomycetes bacterium]|nr:cyclic nucleotide-binding domain-containing protein [Planctomycetota bacterium]